jgi:hypothetical protein
VGSSPKAGIPAAEGTASQVLVVLGSTSQSLAEPESTSQHQAAPGSTVVEGALQQKTEEACSSCPQQGC